MKNEKVKCLECGLEEGRDDREWLEVEVLSRLQCRDTGMEKALPSSGEGPFCSQDCCAKAHDRILRAAELTAKESGIDFAEVSPNSTMAAKMERQEELLSRLTVLMLEAMTMEDFDVEPVNDLCYDNRELIGDHPDAALSSLVATGWIKQDSSDYFAIEQYLKNLTVADRATGLIHLTALKPVIKKAIETRTKEIPLPDSVKEMIAERKEAKPPEGTSMQEVIDKLRGADTDDDDDSFGVVVEYVSGLNPGSGLIYEETFNRAYMGAKGDDGAVVVNELYLEDLIRLRDRATELVEEMKNRD